jgi:hypothetical protein
VCGNVSIHRPYSCAQSLLNNYTMPWCCLTWLLQCSLDGMCKDPTVENRAHPKLCSENHTVETVQNYWRVLRTALKWLTLAERQKRFRLSMVHWCLNGQCPESMQSLFIKSTEMGYESTTGADKATILEKNLVGSHSLSVECGIGAYSYTTSDKSSLVYCRL